GDAVMRRFAGRFEDVVGFDRKAPQPAPPGCVYVRTEQLIHDERGDIPAVLLRISGVYDDLCHSIPLAQQIQRINERDLTSRLYSGSTAHGQAFMHMDDLVDAIERVVERRGSRARARHSTLEPTRTRP
ncbi:MAG TPA: hypothetical protein VGB99_02605, partial [Acidobacteriota bacterium]